MRRIKTNLSGKTCLITGAASGIGAATARAAAARGARLVLTDLQPEPLQALAEELRGRGATVLAAEAADVSNRDEVQSLAQQVHATHDALDVVMNVAGIATWGPVERLEPDHWRRVIDVNLMGPINVIEAFVAPMVRAGRGGHLVNVSSAAGLIGLPWHAPYSASKFGLRGVSEVLRFDLYPHRIGVTLVCPGAVATPLVDSVEIVGIDRRHPAARRMAKRFVDHARTPEQVADTIIRGVERGEYLVLTSPDIRAIVWVQRFVPPLYERAMLRLNRQMLAVAEKAALSEP